MRASLRKTNLAAKCRTDSSKKKQETKRLVRICHGILTWKKGGSELRGKTGR